ncbi:phytoene desaturase family protein [Chitinophaga barathri]|uniref:NAD(P)/FAD-dependent oxidoreductase n=1 Tax=Chitinophaga barathri TaxID=1647451 RepID=A0A3N4MC03_9BACT|nr:NAD(P)/FAD-dependent oxidoreductase [Chitinophaga barathri]RPD41402.1 NAD(P)/FAD-dependent oxidoreductase [Chitinophaga barathri]
MQNPEYDAVVVGSGPNGLAAAITIQQQGLKVLLVEGKSTIGGGLRSAELTLPGFLHDICSAVHPLAAGSPFFKTLPLADHGLQFLYPSLAAAHPFEGGHAAVLSKNLAVTLDSLGKDAAAYRSLIEPLLEYWPLIVNDVLGPLHFPSHPLKMAQFGLKALQPLTTLVRRFKDPFARGLLAGMGAHAIQPLENTATAAIALVLSITGHLQGWPVPQGGSQQIANALAGYFTSLGGRIVTDTHISRLEQLPSHRALLLDVTPKQLLEIAGHRFSSFYKWQLEKYRYGMGVFKIDWALSAPIPFTAAACREAGTVHIGNTIGEITQAERQTAAGHHPDRPFVLLAQQSLMDPSRAPEGKHTAWAYCHVPNGSKKDMTAAIEGQVERFAPGFRNTILARHTFNTEELENYNPNYIGGDINGGIIDVRQLFARPALRRSPYRTSAKGIYICSSSTPPGGGVHGMCGFYAAKCALSDIFNVKLPPLAGATL